MKKDIKVIAVMPAYNAAKTIKKTYQDIPKGADIIVMIHPDYQYDSSLTGELIRPIVAGRFDIMLGSRIRTRKEALEGGMPLVKYLVNRIVSLIENIILGYDNHR